MSCIFYKKTAYIVGMLKLRKTNYYKVKQGQTLKEIAQAFCVAECILAKENHLKSEPFCGQILRIPDTQGNVYTVKVGDTKTLLSGSEGEYERKNGKDLYLGKRVIL